MPYKFFVKILFFHQVILPKIFPPEMSTIAVAEGVFKIRFGLALVSTRHLPTQIRMLLNHGIKKRRQVQAEIYVLETPG